MINTVVYIIFAILTFISFIGIYHFIVLRPYQVKFYQKTNIAEEDYKDMRTYKRKSNRSPFYLLSSIPFMIFFLVVFSFAYYNYDQSHHQSDHINNIVSAFIISKPTNLFFWIFISFILVVFCNFFPYNNSRRWFFRNTIKSRSSDHTTRNQIIEQKLNLKNKTINNKEIKNRWSKLPISHILVLLFILTIIVIFNFKLFFQFTNYHYDSSVFYLFGITSILAPWIILILLKLLIGIINYFSNIKTTNLKLKFWLMKSFNTVDYKINSGYLLLPILIIMALPIAITILPFSYEGIIKFFHSFSS